MNDVLPKPFTKEGLLAMLEKHLSHLKKSSGGGMEQQRLPMGAPSASMTQGEPVASSRQSLKDETSPGNSPATASTNWNSPVQPNHGMSPMGQAPMSSEGYISAVNTFPAYPGMENQVPGMQAGNQFTSPGQMGAAPRAGQPARRGIDQISGGAMMNGSDAKRQQMYTPIPPMNPHRQ